MQCMPCKYISYRQVKFVSIWKVIKQKYFACWHLVLRRAAFSCLRQFAQKEAAEICSIVENQRNTSIKDTLVGENGC